MSYIRYFLKFFKINKGIYLSLFSLLLLSSCEEYAVKQDNQPELGSTESVWTEVSAHEDEPKNKWTGRFVHQVVLKDETFFLFGGNTKEYKNDVWKSRDGKDWGLISAHENNPKNKWSGRFGHQVVLKGEEFYLFGGLVGLAGNDSKNDVWKSRDGVSWTEVLANGAESKSQWESRYEHQVVVKDETFFLFGGKSWRSDDSKNDVWKSRDGKDWGLISAHGNNPKNKWSGRFGHQVVLKDETFYLFGGYDDDFKNDIWSSSDGKSWKLISAHEDNPKNKWTGRFGHQVVLKDETFYLFGGDTAYTKNDIWSSSDGKSWRLISAHEDNPKNKWTARWGHQAVVKDGAFFLFGGVEPTKDRRYKNDVWVFKPKL